MIKRIIPRRLKLSGEGAVKKYQIKNSQLVSTFYYGFIAGLPSGEHMMIETVRSVIDSIDDKALVNDLRGFCGQEAHHANAQTTINTDLESKGFRMSDFRKEYDRYFEYMAELEPCKRAAIHSAYEHLTSVFCAYTLRNISILDGMDKDHYDMMTWHCIEEVEHKAVMFDLLNHLNSSYSLRVWGFYKAFTAAFATTLRFQKAMLKENHYKFSISDTKTFLLFFFGRNGLGLHCLKDAPKYLRKSFHPNDIDDTGILDESGDRLVKLEFESSAKGALNV